MKLYFAGAESPSHLKALRANGVERVALNVTSLYRRIPKSVDWSLQDRFPAPLAVCLYPGPKDDDFSRYRTFLDANPGAQLVVGPVGIEWDDIEGFVPLWDGNVKTINSLCSRSDVVAASEDVLNAPQALKRLRTAAMQQGTRLVALGGARRLLQGRWEAAVVSSWQSAQRYGETQVWDGRELHRYATDQKTEARRRHRADIERLGVDPDAVEADDGKAVVQLAIRSWQAFEASRNHPSEADVVTIGPEGDDEDSGASAIPHPAIAPPLQRHERVRIELPGVSFVDQPEPEMHNGEPVLDGESGEPVMVASGRIRLRVRGDSMRACDTCMLASNCPAFEHHSTCAFSIPVVAETKDDISTIMDAVVAMQAQRILFARFSEEVEGQGLDPAVGSEMDRLFKILGMKKEILDDRDVFRLEMEARGNSGMISRIFGGSAGQQLRQLQEPMRADRVIDVLDQ